MGVMTRSSSAAGRGSHSGPASSPSPVGLGALEIPTDIHAQPFYMSGNPSSSGILDLFHSIGPSGSLPQQSHDAPLLHPDDMLW